MKEVELQGNTKQRLSKFPTTVRRDIGFALYAEKNDEPHQAIKPLKGFKQTVREIRSSYLSNTYRAVYVVNLGDKIYVLHVFEKKATTGIKTPKPDIELIRSRLKALEQILKENKK